MKQNPTPSSQEAHTPSESPYLAARQEWNERYGDFIHAAAIWRNVAFLALGVAALAIGGIFWIASKQQVVPYIVETNSYGEASMVTRLSAAERPNDAQIRAALRKWIIGARTAYVDFRAERLLLDETYAHTLANSAAEAALKAYHAAHHPFERANSETVHVDVNSVLSTGSDSYQIEWTETVKPRGSAAATSVTHWQALATVAVLPPSDDGQLLKNPIGLYVSAFSWTQRLNLQPGGK